MKAESCGDGLWRVDLAANGIGAAALCSRGFGRSISPAHNELFIDGKPLALSRYPKNGGFLTMSDFPDPRKDGDRVWGRAGRPA